MNIDLTFYHKQYRYVIDPARYCGFVGGIGTGKTRGLVAKAFLKAMDNPGSYGVITSPTYPMLRDAVKRTFFETFSILKRIEGSETWSRHWWTSSTMATFSILKRIEGSETPVVQLGPGETEYFQHPLSDRSS